VCARACSREFSLNRGCRFSRVPRLLSPPFPRLARLSVRVTDSSDSRRTPPPPHARRKSASDLIEHSKACRTVTAGCHGCRHKHQAAIHESRKFSIRPNGRAGYAARQTPGPLGMSRPAVSGCVVENVVSHPRLTVFDGIVSPAHWDHVTGASRGRRGTACFHIINNNTRLGSDSALAPRLARYPPCARQEAPPITWKAFIVGSFHSLGWTPIDLSTAQDHYWTQSPRSLYCFAIRGGANTTGGPVPGTKPST